MEERNALLWKSVVAVFALLLVAVGCQIVTGKQTQDHPESISGPTEPAVDPVSYLPPELQKIQSFFIGYQPPESGRISASEATEEEKIDLKSEFIVYENGVVMMKSGRIVHTNGKGRVRPMPGQYKPWIYYKVEKAAEPVISPNGKSLTIRPIVYENAQVLAKKLNALFQAKSPKWTKPLDKDIKMKLENLKDARLFSARDELTGYLQKTIDLLKQAGKRKNYEAYAEACKRILTLEYAIGQAFIHAQHYDE
ncbi:MAG TPA: hypothetical protein VFJ73_01865 [Bacillales bacterium]|nr:hypothetical protein [Bacillales bacterium]